jgi:hypothetical protein
VIGIVWIDLELLTQASDVHVQSLRVTKVVRPPYLRDQVVAGSQAAHARQEGSQQIELLGGHVHVPSANPDLVTAAVKLDRASAENLGVRPADKHSGAPAMGADAGHELAHRKGFRHVVVGAELQSGDAVRFGVLGGDDHDGHRRLGPNNATHIKSGDLRQHQVENDQLRSFGSEEFNSLLTVKREQNPKSLALQRVLNTLSK